jgi:hypothetical protein
MLDEEIQRVVVALNNAGVTMLRRQYFKESMETFKDTLQLMRAIECCSDLDLIRKMCTGLLSHASANTIFSMNSDSDQTQPNVIVSETDIVKQYESMEFQTQDCHICILLNGSDGVEFSESDQKLINCSALLYNYAIAHQINSKMTDNASSKHHINRQGLRLLELSRRIVDDFKLSSDFLDPRVLSVKMLVTRRLMAGSGDIIFTNDDRQTFANSYTEVTEYICKEKQLLASLGPRASAMA